MKRKQRWIFAFLSIACIACVILSVLVTHVAQMPVPEPESTRVDDVYGGQVMLVPAGDESLVHESSNPTLDAAAPSESTREPKAMSTAPDSPVCDASLIVRVLNRETALPVPGVRVSVRPVDPSLKPAGAQRVAKSTATLGEAPLTDEDGRADVALPSGIPFRAEVRAERGARDSVHVEVPALGVGEHREVTVKLVAQDTLRIVGQVVADTDRTPIGGAIVQVFQVGAMSIRENSGKQAEFALDVLGSTETDAMGRFELDLADWQSAYVRIEKPTYGVALRPVEVLASSPEDAHVIALQLSARIRALVLDPDGVPMRDAEVCVWQGGSSSFGAARTSAASLGVPDETRTARTKTDGRCELIDLVPRMPLSVEIRVAGGVILSERNKVVLQPGEIRDVEWRIGERCRLCGTCVDQDGKPVNVHSMWIMRAENDRPRHFRLGDEGGVFATASTDEHGAFCFDGIPPGTWWVGPAVSTRAPERAAQDSVAPVAEVVEVLGDAREQRCVVHLTRGLFLRGRVVDPDGRPAADVVLEARRIGASSFEPGKSTSDGVFAIGPLLAESFDVIARGSGLVADAAAVRATAGDEGLVLRLRRAGVIAGTVIDSITGEVCAARVTVAGGGAGYTTKKSGGESLGFRFDGLAPGMYDLFAHTSDDRVGLLRGVAVDGGREARDLVLRVDAGAKLELTYSGSRKYAIVEIKSGSAPIFRGSIRARRVSAQSVPTGSLEVALMDLDGEVVQVRQVDVASGETKAVELSDTP